MWFVGEMQCVVGGVCIEGFLWIFFQFFSEYVDVCCFYFGYYCMCQWIVCGELCFVVFFYLCLVEVDEVFVYVMF